MMKKAILLLIAIVLTLSLFIAASALSLPAGTEICAEDNESSLQTSAMPAQGGVGNYSKGDTNNITPVAVSADTGDNLGNPAKKMLNDTPSNESNLTKRYVDDKGRVLDEVIVPGLPPEERISEPPVLTKRYVDDKGRVLDEVIVPGLPPEERISGPPVSSSEITRADAILPNVPAFDWCYGCSATSAAMLFGYYDRTGYPNMYTGPTNGGVCPLDNSAWGYEECSLSATHQGFDGLAVKGHVDDYWSAFGSTVDPYYGHWTEHGYADCTADFMGTNQYVNWQNTDGGTRFYYDGSNPVCDYSGCEPGKKRDGCHGMRLFVESRGYNVVQNCNQYIDPYVTGGFTYADFKAEIDAGRPVLIHVEGHTMLGYGYNDPDTIYIHDTWGHTDHSMTWGGSYSGRQHKGVTFIQLEPASGPTAVDYGIFRNGQWILQSYKPLRPVVYRFNFGNPTDIPVTGDWNGDGEITIGVYRNGQWILRDRNSAGSADYRFNYGNPTDKPVTGDWDGDGVDTIGVYRNGQWILRDSNSAGSADYRFNFGNPTDKPVTGDWDGDGVDTIGVYRNGQWILRNSNSAGGANYRFNFGNPTDKPVTGDWDGDGECTIGVYRNGQWILRNSNSAGTADDRFNYGNPTDKPVTGDWDGMYI